MVFIGDGDRAFVDTIHGLYPTSDDAYSNIFPMIQSSGTGKSRLVHEAARSIFTLPINVRSQNENSGKLSLMQLKFLANRTAAYPMPDAFARQYLQNMRDTVEEAMNNHLSFLWGLFEAAKEFLDTRFPADQRFDSEELLAAAWREYLESDNQAVRQKLHERSTEVGWRWLFIFCIADRC